MQNYTHLNDETIQFAGGIFGGITRIEQYPDGELRGLRFSGENKVLTHAGELTPCFTETHRRKNKYSVEYYVNGMLKSVALEEITEVTTPIGELPAELVIFYNTGELKRIFPQDGQISGMWSEEDEKALAIPLNFSFYFAEFTAIINGIGFYRNGDVRSITLFPGEIITVKILDAEIPVHIGFSLFETGELKSLEPAEPITVKTPIGEIIAYDPHALGINADSNSLQFDEQCRITALTTVHNRVGVQTPDGHLKMYAPTEAISKQDGETKITIGLQIAFDYENNTVIFNDGEPLSIEESGFAIADYSNYSHCATPHVCTNCGKH